MDHDRWMSQLASASSNSTDNSNNRYAHDMTQAELMRTTTTRSSSSGKKKSAAATDNSFVVTVDDLDLARKGIDQAKTHRRKGDLEASLKLYELSIELLIKCLKDPSLSGVTPISSRDRSAIETTIHAALTDAEKVKSELQKAAQSSNAATAATKRQQPTKQSSFQSLSNALTSAIETITKKASSPTNQPPPAKQQRGGGPTRQRTSSAQTTSRPTNTRINNSNTHPHVRRTPTSKQQPARQPLNAASTSSSTADNELRQTILSDFYTDPSELQHTTWEDISGLSNVKQSLQETAILPLIRPDLFTGLRRPQNILLWGPPGTGKTMLVRAVAQESKSSLFVCSSSALTSKWMGEAEKLVKKLFQVAHDLAPSIVFLDEMDALLSIRKSDGGGEHEASRRLKTEFMVQMEGINKESEVVGKNVLLIACTNCPWDVDPAVLRRFPRRIFVPLPDPDARRALLKHLLKKAGKHSLTSRQVSTLVNRFEGFSCSDIAAIASEASFGPIRALGGMNAIRGCSANDIRPIQLMDFENVMLEATKSVTVEQLQRYEQWQKQQAAS